MGIGVSVIVDAVVRAFDLVELYTDDGAWPRELLRAEDGPAVALSAHYWASTRSSTPGRVVRPCGSERMALALGWRTRAATLACWYLVSSVLSFILQRNLYVTALGVRLREHMDLLVPLTWASRALERFGPFLAFVPYYTGAFRMLTIVLFWDSISRSTQVPGTRPVGPTGRL
jgi:hypothetical protein